MAFVYTDYMSSVYTPAQRVERCRLHLAELTLAASKPDVSADGRSINYGGLQSRITAVQADLARLESDPRSRSRGTSSIARINR